MLGFFLFFFVVFFLILKWFDFGIILTITVGGFSLSLFWNNKSSQSHCFSGWGLITHPFVCRLLVSYSVVLSVGVSTCRRVLQLPLRPPSDTRSSLSTDFYHFYRFQLLVASLPSLSSVATRSVCQSRGAIQNLRVRVSSSGSFRTRGGGGKKKKKEKKKTIACWGFMLG